MLGWKYLSILRLLFNRFLVSFLLLKSNVSIHFRQIFELGTTLNVQFNSPDFFRADYVVLVMVIFEDCIVTYSC